jgi:outer membrane protein
MVRRVKRLVGLSMSRSRALAVGGVACVAAMLFGAPLAFAQSLNEVLARTYTANPTLNSARAQLRITNEQIPIALAGARPTVSATGSVAQQNSYNSTSVFNT